MTEERSEVERADAASPAEAPAAPSADREPAGSEAASDSGSASGAGEGTAEAAVGSDSGEPSSEGDAIQRPKRRRRRRRRRPEGAGDPETAETPASSAAEAASGGADADAAGSSGEVAAEGAAGEPGSSDAAAAPGERRKKRSPRRRKGRGDKSGDGAAPEGRSGSRPAGRSPKAKSSRQGGGKGRPQGRGQGPGQGRAHGRAHSKSAAQAAVRSLAELAGTLLDAEGIEPWSRPQYLDVRLRIPIDAEQNAAAGVEDLVQQILARVQDVRAHEAALEPGAVFCYFSRSAAVPHARPTSVREVFERYGSTGRPEFTEFKTLAIERRDAGIDELVSGADIVVTHVSMGRALRTQQLQEFGAEASVYRILGQVDAGMFAMLSGDEKAAFSFQLLRAESLDGAPRFRLHWVGAADVRDIADPGIAQILKRFQQRLDRESLRFAGLIANGESPDEEEFVLPLLQELAKRLAGRARRAGKRTDHANQRTEEGQRPTTKCWDDARDAGDDAILRDDAQGTMVVCGPRNRVHVFSPEAKHVTSFVLTGRNVAKRRQEGRWHPAEPEERGEFRLALRRRLREQSDEEVSAEGATSPEATPATDRSE